MKLSPALLCAALLAQNQPEVSTQEAPVTFSTRVNLVSVPVVARDKEGRTVGTLRQEDFQLFDKGKLQTITKFSIQKSRSAESVVTAATEEQTDASVKSQPVLPERYVAYLFDDVHLTISDLLQARQAMNRHLDTSLDPLARAAIFLTSGRMLADFTDDREKLHKAVNSIQPWTSLTDPEQGCPPMSYYIADLLANQYLYFDLSNEDLAARIRGGQADKLLTAEMDAIVSCGQEVAGSVNMNTHMADPLIDAIIQTKAAARRVLAYGDRENSFSLGAIEDVVRRISVMGGSRTIVLVSAGFIMTRDHYSHEYAALDKAIRANVTVNTIDIRGLFTTIPGGNASSRGIGDTGELAQANMTGAKQQQDVLAEIADGTGGTFFHNDNGLKEGLDQIAARPEYVYVLGYSPQDLKTDGSYHGLKVTVKGVSGTTLQFRRGYWAPKHATDPAENAREEIREAVFSREETQDIPMDLQTEFFKSTDTAAELTVVAHVDLKGLKFRKADDRNNDTLTVVSGLFDSNGNFVNGIQKVVELHLRDQTLVAMQNTRVTLNQTFNVGPGRYVVRVVVRDAEGKTMSARNGGVEIP